MNARTVVLEITPLEAAHLSGLVSQFTQLIDQSTDAVGTADPAVQRLVPDAYADAEEADEFRALTESDLLGRRQADAAAVVASLGDMPDLPEDPEDPRLVEGVVVVLDADSAQAWLRTLAAIRLVLATRLGIVADDDHDTDDPRFGIYDWLGFRLDGLVRAIDEA